MRALDKPSRIRHSGGCHEVSQSVKQVSPEAARTIAAIQKRFSVKFLAKLARDFKRLVAAKKGHQITDR